MPFLSKEDYEEPLCPLEKPGAVNRIPVARIREKLDEYMFRNDADAARQHLRYWLEEAEFQRDEDGKLCILNEQVGMYRMLEQKDEALSAAEKALALARHPALLDTVTLATTLINAATAYKAFGMAEKAMPLYEEARAIYETRLKPDDSRLGGLYNNMGLACVETGEWAKARELYAKALEVMARCERGETDEAITWCNLADLEAAEKGPVDSEEAVRACLKKARELLDTPDLPRGSYYAYVCEKCAPVFGYYGLFLDERELTRRAEAIHERT